MSDESDESDEQDVPDAWRMMTLADLRALPMRELEQRCDVMLEADRGLFGVGVEDYLAERERRRTDRQTTALIWLTWVIAILTGEAH
jgi:hypothetical protein